MIAVSTSRSVSRPLARASDVAQGGYAGPALSLDFLEQQYRMGRAGTYPPQRLFGDLITFTRSTTATRYNHLGLLETVAANQPRFDHDPSTVASSTSSVAIGIGSKTFAVGRQFAIGETVRATADSTHWVVGKVTAATAISVTIEVTRTFAGSGTFASWTLIRVRGLLVEEQRTNLVLRSSELDNASWSKSNATVTANAGVFIDGTASFDVVIPNTTSANHNVFQGGFSVTSGVTYTWSFFAKAAGYNFVNVNSNSSVFGSNDYATFDLANGVVTQQGSSGTAGMDACGNGIYRCWKTIAATGIGTASMFIEATNIGTGGRDSVFAGDGVSGVLVGGVQWETGYLTSYIPTTSAQVTRAADAVSVNSLSPWYRAEEGTFIAKGELRTRAGADKVSLDIGAGGAFGTTAYISHASNLDAANPSIAPINLSSTVANTSLLFNSAMALRANDSMLVSNGTAGAVDTSCSMPVAPTAMFLGKGGWAGAGSHLNGHLRSVDYYPRRMPSADLQALTAA